MPARVVDRMLAGDKYRRSVENDTGFWRVNYFETDLTMHDVLPLYRRERGRVSQPPMPNTEPLSVMPKLAPILRESRGLRPAEAA
jgi:hypothetical protein